MLIKKKHMQSLCENLNLDAEFIEAVDGSRLNSTIIETDYSPKESIQNIGRDLSNAEIGCALSHRFIYKKIIDENISKALIFEDDISLEITIKHFLTKNGFFETDNIWDTILLGHHGASRGKEIRHTLWFRKIISSDCFLRKPTPKKINYGTYSYAISNNGAKKLLRATENLNQPIDHYTGNSIYSNLYYVQNPIAHIHTDFKDASNIENTRKLLRMTNYQIPTPKYLLFIKTILKFTHLYKPLLTTYFFLINLISYFKNIYSVTIPLMPYK